VNYDCFFLNVNIFFELFVNYLLYYNVGTE